MATRTLAQQTAWQAHIERNINWNRRQARQYQEAAAALEQRLAAPADYPHYCDDCGEGHSSDYGARACCDDGHP